MYGTELPLAAGHVGHAVPRASGPDLCRARGRGLRDHRLRLPGSLGLRGRRRDLASGRPTRPGPWPRCRRCPARPAWPPWPWPGVRRRGRAGQSPGAARTVGHLGLAPAAGSERRGPAAARWPGGEWGGGPTIRAADASRRRAGRGRPSAGDGRHRRRGDRRCGSAASAASRSPSTAGPWTSRRPSPWNGPCCTCWPPGPVSRSTGKRSSRPSGPKPTRTPGCTGCKWRSRRCAACWPPIRAVPSQLLARQGDSYRLALPEDSDCDLWQFEAHLRRAAAAEQPASTAPRRRRWRRPSPRYGGPLLPGDGPADWVVDRRAALQQAAADAAARLANLRLERGQHRAADRGGSRSACRWTAIGTSCGSC